MVKFSHSIQLNATPEQYSNLKKLIYSIEKSMLGLASSTHITDSSSPLLSSASTTELVTEQMFIDALDKEQNRVVEFYKKTEHSLYLKLEHFLAELAFAESYEVKNALLRPDLEDSVELAREPDASTPSVIIQDSQEAAFAWTTPAMKKRKHALSSACVDLYVSLSNLRNYVELNYSGFSKILKKYDKVTGSALKRTYLSKVDTAYPFLSHTRVSLSGKIGTVVDGFARMNAEGRADLAKNELDSHLREQIVWERNTIWKDMIEQERRTASIGMKRSARTLGERREAAEAKALTLFGRKIVLPDFVNFSSAMLLFTLLVFGVLCSFQVLDTIEQSRCLAILVLATMLWAFELVPLFVTSMLIPLLVVMLRVLRKPLITDPHTTPPGMPQQYYRLEAKDAAKLVFSEMFSPVIMLLLGGFSLAAALSKHHIAKGMASFVLAKAGSAPHRVILANMFVSTFASMWISNVAAPVLCFELIRPILRNLPHKSDYARALILGIAMAANVGGMASPIASPQNIIAVNNMAPSPSWPQWFAISLPVCIIIDLCVWGLLLLVFKPQDVTTPPEIYAHPKRTRVDDDEEVRGVGRGFRYSSEDGWSRTQLFILGVTFATIVLWCFESVLEGLFGDMGVIAIIPMVAFFGTGILTKEDFNNFLWTVIMLAMGGISLGKAVQLSGLLESITASMIPYLAQLSPYACFAVITGVILVATTFVSHTVGALIILPVVKQVGEMLPVPMGRTLVMGSALMCSGAMGLPVSSFPNMNAISYVCLMVFIFYRQEDPTGVPWLKVADFLKIGLVSSVIAWICTNTLAYGIMVLIDFK